MRTKTNPAARASANRVLEIKAFQAAFDEQNPTQNPSEFQSETLAVLAVMRRCRVSIYHARTVCELAGIGGAA